MKKFWKQFVLLITGKPTEFVLDYSKWRCGAYGPHHLGKGYTQLLNAEGFMCCLGQASLQFKPTLQPKNIIYHDNPNEVAMIIPGLTEKGNYSITNTDFSREAMRINDNSITTPKEKIVLLTELFAKHGIKMVVINRPETLSS